ncbi:hypothetical protein ABI59_05445 [Acidobacteria bacterium Mor1]|nr:hypothetical protein ABI59_05445 [Acidobacteria bacterium Mor1]
MQPDYRLRTIISLTAVLALAPALALGCLTPGTAGAHGNDQAPYDYYRAVFEGDLSGAPDALEGNRPVTRAPEPEEFRARFLDRSDGIAMEDIDDEAVRRVAGLFQDYWRDTLLQPAQREAQESSLRDALLAELESAGFAPDGLTRDTVIDLLPEFLESRGYHAISGRTPPLLELMLWKENVDEVASVELTDGTHEIPVRHAVGFLSHGWGHFASFGHASTGGWATRERLFCVRSSWNLEGEGYQVSFLKHEGQHYVDYGRFPKLESADLEYRAKLTELAFAETRLNHLLERFHRGGVEGSTSPHPRANWQVMRDLAELLGGDADTDGWWENTPADRIHQAARRLLERHAAALEQAGPDTPGLLR